MAVCFFAEIDISWACLYRYSKLPVNFASEEFIVNDLTFVVIGKRINRGAGNGLEIPVK